jgi:hypothetical protein
MRINAQRKMHRLSFAKAVHLGVFEDREKSTVADL